jgi:uncharacterized protein (DUF433 family)
MGRTSFIDNYLFCCLKRNISAKGAAGAARLTGVRYDEHVQNLRRITIDPDVMGGKPCVRGMRVTVGMIVESIAASRTVEELLSDFPYLEEQDIREALAFAASLAQGREVHLAS